MSGLAGNDPLAAAPAEAEDPVSVLQDYWRKPFDIEYVRFSRDPSYYRNSGTNITRFIEHEASSHSGTFYVSQLTDVLNPTNRNSKAEITGESLRDFWVVHGTDVAIADKRREISGTNTHPEVSAVGMKRVFDDSLNLGINGLLKESMVWNTRTTFVAQSVGSGTIRGSLLLKEGGQVAGLAYTYDGIPGMTCRVDYAYGGSLLPPWMPTQVVMNYYSQGRGLTSRCTNMIHELRMGSQWPGAAGFIPSQFVPNMDWANPMAYYSDGVAHIVRDGKVMRTVEPSHERRVVQSSHHKALKLSAALIPALVVVCFYVRKWSVKTKAGLRD